MYGVTQWSEHNLSLSGPREDIEFKTIKFCPILKFHKKWEELQKI